MKRTPLKRRTALRARSIRRRRPVPIPADVAAAVGLRSAGGCEWPSCSTVATDLHHRKMRSQGGGHTVTNLAHLCRTHHQLIHDHPADSYESGWLIRGNP